MNLLDKIKIPGFFVKPQLSVGLDIGSSNIKLVVLEKEGKEKTLKKFSFAALAPELNLAASLDAFMKLQGIPCRQVNVSFSGLAVIMRYITFPRMTLVELKSTMQFEAKEHIPFPLEEVILDCAILKERIENNKMLVALAAVRKAMVQERIGILEEAGLEPGIIDVDCFCLANAFNNNYPWTADTGMAGRDEIIGLLNVGARWTNMAIIENGVLQFSRDIAFGGQEAALGNLLAEISSSMDYYENQNGKPIKKIYLSGGLGQSPDITSSLEHQLALPIANFDAFSGVTLDPALNAEELKAQVSLFAIAFGLALR